MPQLVAPFIILLVMLLAMNMFLRAQPAKVAASLQWFVGGTLIVLALLFLSRGLVPIAIALFLAGAFSLAARGQFANWGNRTGGQASRVKTKILAMELDHDSGALNGQVIAGNFSGRMLSDLALADLMQLRKECLAAEDQSARLLDAYLDRMHDGWRDTHDGQTGGEGGGETVMTPDEAYEILGLNRGAGKSEIQKAHRTLMKKFHPDHGGSEYLAQKINEARDLLLELI